GGAKPPSLPPGAHQIHEYLYLVWVLGARPEPLPPHICVTPEEIAAARQKFGLSGRADGKSDWIGLNPGAEYGPAKRWPVENFAGAAIELARQTGCRLAIFGGPGDAELTKGLEERIRAGAKEAGTNPETTSLAGKTSLRELCATLACCRLVVTNDTGPMHLAAAVGTPVVVPYGSTAPDLTAPGLPGDPRHQLLRSTAPCAPCFLRECPIDFRCLRGIAVGQVVEAALRVWKKRE
ncbi:MAG TPA: lipopolysaccharide heptosyltransferase II, partial [Verrucomicrobiae bacterium]|nr:lipopolysaccharide heptosyltransferase II [Verrucomicrobiae bacterium]